MATFALTDAYFALNSTDLSNDVKSLTLTVDTAELDDTAMGDTWQSVLAGLKSGKITVQFNQDVAASQVDATLWPLFGTVTTFEIRPDSASAGADNPKFTGSALVKTYAPVGGTVGDLASAPIDLTISGAVTRAVA